MSAPVATSKDVLAFWFGDKDPWAHRTMWFEDGRSLDATVREKFLPTVEAALAGELDSWCATPHGTVALIVVLDQFTRHCFRDTPRFVAGDARAQRLAIGMFDAKHDVHLNSAQKAFLLTAMEHAEDRYVQDRAVGEARRLAGIHPHELTDMVPYVKEHAEIVQKFGRFPDRNVLLGRQSTPEEQTFLEENPKPWFETQDLPPA